MIRISASAKEKFYHILEKHVPQNAIHYCLDLWTSKPFHFKVTRRRQTKLGDYRFDPRTKEHTITVNHNLNPYNFLITYIHEYAHLLTTEKHHRRVSPHGKEWQREFQIALGPMLTTLIFPEELLKELMRHMRNPKASTQSDPNLVKALRKYDEPGEDNFVLDEIETGEHFIFKGNLYQKLENRRTRVVCNHVVTGRKYLIPKIARVERES